MDVLHEHAGLTITNIDEAFELEVLADGDFAQCFTVQILGLHIVYKWILIKVVLPKETLEVFNDNHLIGLRHKDFVFQNGYVLRDPVHDSRICRIQKLGFKT